MRFPRPILAESLSVIKIDGVRLGLGCVSPRHDCAWDRQQTAHASDAGIVDFLLTIGHARTEHETQANADEDAAKKLPGEFHNE